MLRVSPLCLALASLALAACRSTEPSPAPPPSVAAVPTASAAPPAPTASPAPRPTSPCGDLLARNAAFLEPLEGDALPSYAALLREACYPTAHGAWGLSLDDWSRRSDPDAYPEFSGSLQVYYYRDGQEVPWSGRVVMNQGLDFSTVEKPRLVDIDGDGEQELFLAVDQKVHEGPGTRENHLLTWKTSLIAAYPGLPAHVEEMDDIDHDGRMDFIYIPYAEEREANCSGFGFQWMGPRLLAHGLAGGKFSLDDKVARDFLKQTCPEPVKKKPAARKGKAKADDRRDHSDPQLPELCARLWGQSEKEAEALLKADCRAPKNAEEACQEPPGVCSDYKERLETMKKTPPLLLNKP